MEGLENDATHNRNRPCPYAIGGLAVLLGTVETVVSACRSQLRHCQRIHLSLYCNTRIGKATLTMHIRSLQVQTLKAVV